MNIHEVTWYIAPTLSISKIWGLYSLVHAQLHQHLLQMVQSHNSKQKASLRKYFINKSFTAHSKKRIIMILLVRWNLVRLELNGITNSDSLVTLLLKV